MQISYIGTSHSANLFMKKCPDYITLLLNSLAGILRDTDMIQVPSQMALSASQSHAFQYINRILSNMEPFSNEEIDVDVDETEGNNVRFCFI